MCLDLWCSSRVCKHTDVYGFNGYKKSDAKTYATGVENNITNWPYHYFDEVEGESGTHNFDMTFKIVELLMEHVNMTVH
jgi:hypothetical protein